MNIGAGPVSFNGTLKFENEQKIKDFLLDPTVSLSKKQKLVDKLESFKVEAKKIVADSNNVPNGDTLVVRFTDRIPQNFSLEYEDVQGNKRSSIEAYNAGGKVDNYYSLDEISAKKPVSAMLLPSIKGLREQIASQVIPARMLLDRAMQVFNSK